MSFYDKASLLTIPTAYKTSKLYSVKPTDGSGDFTFARSTTGTRVNESGLIESVGVNVPRIDYSSGTPSLLLEPQRTNLVPHSEYIANWQLIGSVTATANYGTSPEGVQNSTRLLFTGASQEAREAVTSVTGCVASIYVKGTSGETIKFGSSGSEELFTLNGSWQRIDKYNSGSPNHITINTYSGATARDIEVWGAQIEEGAYPTSYIPTYGTSVTRVDEQLSDYSITPTNSLTLYAKVSNISPSGGGGEFILKSSSGLLLFRVYVQSFNNIALITFRYESTGETFYYNTNTSVDDDQKWAFQISGTTAKAFCNGQLVKTFTIIQSLIEFLNIRVQGTRYNTKEVLLFPTALSDAECITLTTI